MKKINLAVTGGLGRMGQEIIKSVRSDKNFKLITITESKELNKKIAGIKISQNTTEAFKKVNFGILLIIRRSSKILLLFDKNFITVLAEF